MKCFGDDESTDRCSKIHTLRPLSSEISLPQVADNILYFSSSSREGIGNGAREAVSLYE